MALSNACTIVGRENDVELVPDRNNNLQRWICQEHLLLEEIRNDLRDRQISSQIHAWASTSAHSLNPYISKHTFSAEMQFERVQARTKVLLLWMNRLVYQFPYVAEPIRIRLNRFNTIPGVRIGLNQNIVVWQVPGYDMPIIEMCTKDQMLVYIMPLSYYQIVDLEELDNYIADLRSYKYQFAIQNSDYTSIEIPVLMCRRQVDTHWINEMRLQLRTERRPPRWTIDQSRHLVEIKMNIPAVSGWHKNSHDAVRNPLQVHNSFILWIEHPRIQYPLFSMYADVAELPDLTRRR
ncbi:MAG: hypothetical protein ACOCXQ_00740 [Patescibacteria group bacterium]